MASIIKHKDGYRAHVAVKGVRKSAVFRTKREALAWAAATETEIREAVGSAIEAGHSLGDLFRKYGDEVTPTKRGARWELIRLAAFARQFDPGIPVTQVTPELIGAWRDERLALRVTGFKVRSMSVHTSSSSL